MSQYTSQQLQTLKKAIALGAMEVRYADGRTVKYRSLAEMKAILHDMEADLGLIPRRKNFAVATHKRGL